MTLSCNCALPYFNPGCCERCSVYLREFSNTSNIIEFTEYKNYDTTIGLTFDNPGLRKIVLDKLNELTKNNEESFDPPV